MTLSLFRTGPPPVCSRWCNMERPLSQPQPWRRRSAAAQISSRGGQGTAFSSASQIVNVSDLASSIDAGQASVALSGFLGGFDGQDDNMTVTATFLSSTSDPLGVLSIGPVTQPDRDGLTTLLFRSISGALPGHL